MKDRLGPYILGPNDTPENGIYTGDARELAKAIRFILALMEGMR